MELKDFVVTPIVIFVVYALAYIIRPKVTDINTRRYFFPALTVKIIGAIAVGLVYQFYYDGGDTFAYHTHGSRVIWEAFMANPATGIKLFFNAPVTGDVYNYAHRIWYYGDSSSFFVIRISFLFDLLTLSTYSGTAVLFGVFGFSGLWALFVTFYNKFKNIHLALAIAVLFVPSVFFWGSGILKDTITMSCLGWLTWSFNQFLIKNQLNLMSLLIFIIVGWIIYEIKVYILISFIPALTVWLYFEKLKEVRNRFIRILIAPFLLAGILFIGWTIFSEVSKNNPKYQLTNIAETAKITAYDIRFGWGARYGNGSGYYLGELDGTFSSMLRLMPAAINVSLFRPYIWEVKNPLMLLSSIESLFLLIVTFYLMIKLRVYKLFLLAQQPEIVFCLTFSLIFAFAVGVSTYNFGTLSRYKIPLMPFYLAGIIILYYESTKKRNEFTKI